MPLMYQEIRLASKDENNRGPIVEAVMLVTCELHPIRYFGFSVSFLAHAECLERSRCMIAIRQAPYIYETMKMGGKVL